MELSDATFGDPILVVGVYSGKSYALALAATRYDPFIGSEDTVVSVVVLYLDTPVKGVLLECCFAFDGFICRRCLLQPDEAEPGYLVDVYRRILVSLGGQYACQLGD